MTREENGLDQVVSRTVRDSLEKIQRTSEELSQAVADLVSACASARPMNSLPPMLRAQTSAASLGAALEVLSRFVTFSLQPATPAVQNGSEPALNQDIRADIRPEKRAQEPHATAESFERPSESRAEQARELVSEPFTAPMKQSLAESLPESTSRAIFEPTSEPAPQSLHESMPKPATGEADWVQASGIASGANTEDAAPEASTAAAETPSENGPESGPENSWDESSRATLETVPSLDASEIIDQRVPSSFEGASESRGENAASDPARFADYSEMPVDVPIAGRDFPNSQPGFDILSLAPEEQELHRRANRVAKVSMQDIKLLRPDDVRLGLENRDLCFRLRDDLERAHKEYERRFQTIQGHPVDYFYDWLVEILANGDPQVLGEYPYPSTVFRH